MKKFLRLVSVSVLLAGTVALTAGAMLSKCESDDGDICECAGVCEADATTCRCLD